MEMNLPEKMEQSIIGELTSLTVNLGEVALDAALQEGLFRDIPILGSLVSVGKVAVTIPDMIFYRKVIRFLSEIKTTSIEQRQRFVDKIKKKPELLSDVGSYTLAILNKLDEDRKADLIGSIYCLMIEEKLELEMGFRMVCIIESLFYNDIISFSNYNEKGFDSKDLLTNVISGTGLISGIDPATAMTYSRSIVARNSKYSITDFGLEFKRVISEILL